MKANAWKWMAASVMAVLLLANWSIWQNQSILDNGRLVSLELVPVDPRSLLQGDYMALDYQLERQIEDQVERSEVVSHDTIVANINDASLATFERLGDSETLSKNQILLSYRVTPRGIRIGTDAFFFEEGEASRYNGAKYGQFRVNDSGELRLVSLLDDNFQKL